MGKKRRNVMLEEDRYDLTPMIDVVFLLLIYFMVTTDLTEEADMSIRLPTPPVENTPPPDPPSEHLVDVLPSGEVRLNGATMDHLDSRTMPELVRTLERLKRNADQAGKKTAVTIYADPASLHQRSIDVLNACAAAKIKMVSFAASDS